MAPHDLAYRTALRTVKQIILIVQARNRMLYRLLGILHPKSPGFLRSCACMRAGNGQQKRIESPVGARRRVTSPLRKYGLILLA
jgi:hypothetical protein